MGWHCPLAKDRLLFLPLDTNCIFCSQEQESHDHLFFKCPWTSSLWGDTVHWLHIHCHMSSLTSAIRDLISKRNKMEHKMRRASLGILVYLIWEEKNKRLFDNSYTSVEKVFRRLQFLFFIVFHFQERDHFSIDVGLRVCGWWVVVGYYCLRVWSLQLV